MRKEEARLKGKMKIKKYNSGQERGKPDEIVEFEEKAMSRGARNKERAKKKRGES